MSSSNDGTSHLSRGPQNPSMDSGAIDAATLKVRTHSLLQHGIENLRIVSESRFLELVRGVVRESRLGPTDDVHFAPRSTDVVAPQPLDPLHAADVDEAYSKKWSELRSRHDESLRNIEGRMERLSTAFRSMEGLFEKVEARRQKDPAGEEKCSPLDKKNALLREMLLERKDSPS